MNIQWKKTGDGYEYSPVSNITLYICLDRKLLSDRCWGEELPIRMQKVWYWRVEVSTSNGLLKEIDDLLWDLDRCKEEALIGFENLKKEWEELVVTMSETVSSLLKKQELTIKLKEKIEPLLREEGFTTEEISSFFVFFNTSRFLRGVATLYSEGKVFVGYDAIYQTWRWKAASKEGEKELASLS